MRGLASSAVVVLLAAAPMADLAGQRVESRLLARRDSSWWVPLTSALLPGAGQVLLGQDRFLAYLAVEAVALFGYLNHRAEEARERNRSRALARDVARASFPGSRPDAAWDYYEIMEKAQWIESGVFDRLIPGTFSPEIDVTTYNGALWFDIRQRRWADPAVEPDHASAEYRGAINEYNDRAIRPEYRWSWRNAQLEQDLFRTSIRRKNSAARAAGAQASLLVANHLLSAVDAFVTIRLLGGAGAGNSDMQVIASLPLARVFGPRSR